MKSLDSARRHLRRVDPILGKVIARIPTPQTKKRRGNYFKSLVEAIISQQLSNKAADTIIIRFRKLFHQSGFPTPQQVLRMPTEKIRSAGLSYGKISYIKDLAKAMETRQLNIRQLHRLSDEEVIAHLTQIKGIGRWTAEMFLMFSLDRPDVFSHGDLGLRNAIHKLYGFKKPPTVKQIEKIVLKWQPHRTLASRYLWRSLDNKN
jgi:DNA-3-methyladenine glycosylase II